MLRQLSQKHIKENWKKYKAHIEKAFVSTPGGNIISSGGPQDIYKVIYKLLMNPNSNTTHLWMDDAENYLILTEMQKCMYTGKKTLLLTSQTRFKKTNSKTSKQIYLDIHNTIGKFAKENQCVGMYTYSDLDYFAKIAKETYEWSKVITRYQFYFPL